MAFTSRAPRLQTSADRYYRFFDEGQQIGVDLVVRFENALMLKYDAEKAAGIISMSAFGAVADIGHCIVPMNYDAIDPSLLFDDQSCCDAQRGTRATMW
jgi:hypothetical protein